VVISFLAFPEEFSRLEPPGRKPIALTNPGTRELNEYHITQKHRDRWYNSSQNHSSLIDFSFNSEAKKLLSDPKAISRQLWLEFVMEKSNFGQGSASMPGDTNYYRQRFSKPPARVLNEFNITPALKSNWLRSAHFHRKLFKSAFHPKSHATALLNSTAPTIPKSLWLEYITLERSKMADATLSDPKTRKSKKTDNTVVDDEVSSSEDEMDPMEPEQEEHMVFVEQNHQLRRPPTLQVKNSIILSDEHEEECHEVLSPKSPVLSSAVFEDGVWRPGHDNNDTSHGDDNIEWGED